MIKDSKGNVISIGDNVKVLWGYDNKIHTGRIKKIRQNIVTIATINATIATSDQMKITKIHTK